MGENGGVAEIVGAPDEQRRYRTVRVEPELLAAVIGRGTGIAIPDESIEDLRLVALRFNHWTSLVEFLVASESFEPVPEGAAPPLWQPQYRRVDAA